MIFDLWRSAEPFDLGNTEISSYKGGNVHFWGVFESSGMDVTLLRKKSAQLFRNLISYIFFEYGSVETSIILFT